MRMSWFKRLQLPPVYRVASLIVLAAGIPTAGSADDDIHPMMTSKYWVAAGGFFAARDLVVSAKGELGVDIPAPNVDFESSVGADDKPKLLMIEAGWRFTENWSFILQHFGSNRSGSKTIDKQIEWDGLTFDVGASVYGKSEFDITRGFFSRHFRGDGAHSLQVGAGLHYMNLGVEYGGDATINDGTTTFESSRKSTSAPIPNIGAWYRYSPTDRWLFSTRVDWLSASVGDIKGGIWNAAAGVNYSVSEHFGVGLAYQFFEVDITTNETNWTGDVRARFHGPNLAFTAHW